MYCIHVYLDTMLERTECVVRLSVLGRVALRINTERVRSASSVCKSEKSRHLIQKVIQHTSYVLVLLYDSLTSENRTLAHNDAPLCLF